MGRRALVCLATGQDSDDLHRFVASRGGGRKGRRPWPAEGPQAPTAHPQPPAAARGRAPAPGGLAARARVLPARPWGRVAGRRPSRSVGRRGTSGLGGDTGPCPGGRGAKAGGGAAGLAGTARRKGRLAAASAAPGAQCRPGRGATTRGPPEQELQRRREQKRRRHDAQQLQQLQHLESFYEKPPPGLIKEDETKPEDCIPDVPGNEHAREFLAHAPTKGLWMPLGKEVKVMQCWRCKRHMKIPCMTSYKRIKDMKRM
ncbi:uncharacterized protein [Manis javanica]|uniref:uncharacterized protein n=1 Tax=Manis javanica TaxID=9974 RepID=UPI003C6D91DA